MTPKKFQKEIDKMRAAAPNFIERQAPLVAANIAIKEFKHNFQTESFDGKEWKEVQRRDGKSATYKYAAKKHSERTTRKILTGDTGALGRSIELKGADKGRAPYGHHHRRSTVKSPTVRYITRV